MDNVSALPKLYSEDEVRTYLGVNGKPLSRPTMVRLRRRKRIGYLIIGGRACYTEEHIKKYLEKQTQCPASESPTNTASSSGKGPPTGTSNGASAGKNSAALQALKTLSKPESPPET